MTNDRLYEMPFAPSGSNYYSVTFEQYYPQNVQIESLPSSYVLAMAIYLFGMDEHFIGRIREIQQELGVDTTVWGLRLEGGKFSIELYFYHVKLFKKHSFENLLKLFNPYMNIPFTNQKLEDGYYLISCDLMSRNIDGLNIYYSTPDTALPILRHEETELYHNHEGNITTSYYLNPLKSGLEKRNTYYAYFNPIRDFYNIKRIYSCCCELFPHEDPIIANRFLSFPYVYDADRNRFFHPYCIAKKELAVGVYYKGFSVNQFISFLKYHEYSETFIRQIEIDKQNLIHLQFDIGIDFYLQKNQFLIKKTAFFGAF